MEVSDGLSLTLGSTTIALLIKEFFAWRRSRSQKTEIAPDPLHIERSPKYVTVQEFPRTGYRPSWNFPESLETSFHTLVLPPSECRRPVWRWLSTT